MHYGLVVEACIVQILPLQAAVGPEQLKGFCEWVAWAAKTQVDLSTQEGAQWYKGK